MTYCPLLFTPMTLTDRAQICKSGIKPSSIWKVFAFVATWLSLTTLFFPLLAFAKDGELGLLFPLVVPQSRKIYSVTKLYKNGYRVSLELDTCLFCARRRKKRTWCAPYAPYQSSYTCRHHRPQALATEPWCFLSSGCRTNFLAYDRMRMCSVPNWSAESSLREMASLRMHMCQGSLQ